MAFTNTIEVPRYYTEDKSITITYKASFLPYSSRTQYQFIVSKDLFESLNQFFICIGDLISVSEMQDELLVTVQGI